MSERVLKVAVVGHTNAGKTSLMRTVTRDATFGEVSDRPATTRAVSGVELVVDGQPVMELYDTPGLEDSIGLLELLDETTEGKRSTRADDVAALERFLQSPEAHGSFSQEAKALRQVLASDIALYVIDGRDRVLAKHRDELEILSRCAKPIVPVLNFIANEHARTGAWREQHARTGAWREQLARTGLHAVAEFDTVVLDTEGERRLYEKMQSLLDQRGAALDGLIEQRKQAHESLITCSARLIADLLIDTASFVEHVDSREKEQVHDAIEKLKQRIRDREQRTVDQLLDLHSFTAADFETASEKNASGIPLEKGRWGLDLFSPAALKRQGMYAGGGAAAGAAFGAVIDSMTLWASMGAATGLGALIGGAIGAVGPNSRRLARLASGINELRCDEPTLRLLAARQIELTRALLKRGHASTAPIRFGEAIAISGSDKSIDTVIEQLEMVVAEISTPSGSGGISAGADSKRRRSRSQPLVQSIIQAIRP